VIQIPPRLASCHRHRFAAMVEHMAKTDMAPTDWNIAPRLRK
jgi:hypothetical protein